MSSEAICHFLLEAREITGLAPDELLDIELPVAVYLVNSDRTVGSRLG